MAWLFYSFSVDQLSDSHVIRMLYTSISLKHTDTPTLSSLPLQPLLQLIHTHGQTMIIWVSSSEPFPSSLPPRGEDVKYLRKNLSVRMMPCTCGVKVMGWLAASVDDYSTNLVDDSESITVLVTHGTMLFRI